ncbi:MAG: hypothetical protein ABIJ00_13815 [Candidatus Eisenbacteria bacterium]
MTEISAHTCKACGKRTHVRHSHCPACKGTSFDEGMVGGKAKLLTFTRVHALSLAYEDLHITLGIVEFEDGCRALGRLYVDEPRIGMELTAEIGTVRVRDLEEVKGLCFR